MSDRLWIVSETRVKINNWFRIYARPIILGHIYMINYRVKRTFFYHSTKAVWTREGKNVILTWETKLKILTFISKDQILPQEKKWLQAVFSFLNLILSVNIFVEYVYKPLNIKDQNHIKTDNKCYRKNNAHAYKWMWHYNHYISITHLK